MAEFTQYTLGTYAVINSSKTARTVEELYIQYTCNPLITHIKLPKAPSFTDPSTRFICTFPDQSEIGAISLNCLKEIIGLNSLVEGFNQRWVRYNPDLTSYPKENIYVKMNSQYHFALLRFDIRKTPHELFARSSPPPLPAVLSPAAPTTTLGVRPDRTVVPPVISALPSECFLSKYILQHRKLLNDEVYLITFTRHKKSYVLMQKLDYAKLFKIKYPATIKRFATAQDSEDPSKLLREKHTWDEHYISVLSADEYRTAYGVYPPTLKQHQILSIDKSVT